MKTKCTIFAILLGAVILCGALFVKKHGSPIAGNEQSGNTNSLLAEAATETISQTNEVNEKGYFKKITDPESGLYAIISLDKNTVSLKDKNGKSIWTVNVTNSSPPLSSGCMVGLMFEGHRIFGTSPFKGGGYSPFWIDVDTGKVTVSGGEHIP
jgi:outer membrane protein assembly factor BamB